jgi:NADH oxidase (H2O2-forming)
MVIVTNIEVVVLSRRIVIIGANAAGVDAAVASRKFDRKCEITLLSKEDWGAYSRCGLPFVLSNRIPAFKNLIVYPPNFYRMMKFDLRVKTTATHIDIDGKTVEFETENGKQETIDYDSLILATGGHPFVPPIKGLDKAGVFTIHTLNDGEKIFKAMRKAKSAVVIGTGLAGLETGEAFIENNIKTTIIEMFPSVLPGKLDEDISREIQERFEEHGVNFSLGKPAEAINGDDSVKSVSAGGEEIAADIVINAAGVRPNVDLAKDAGIAVGETRGIKTNIRMQTSAEDVYAAGDCAETTHRITSRPALPLLGSTAVKMGKVAGINAAGGYALFPGTLGSWVSQMFDFEIGAVGLTKFWASKFGMEVVVGKMSGSTRAAYYPGGKPLKVKLIIEKESKQIIGGQIFGGEDVTQRTNLLSLAIQNKMTVQELAKADTCYAPSVCETWEPIVLAAEIAIRRL